MLSFKPIVIESLSKIKNFINNKENRLCDHTIGALYMWRDFYSSKYTFLNDMLYMQVEFSNDQTYFTLPMGTGNMEQALDELTEYTKQNNTQLKFCIIPEESIELLEKHYKNIEYNANRDWSDYLYFSEDLSGLKGRKYSGQRNHMNKFKKLYPNYEYVEMNQDNIEKVLDFYEIYEANNVKAMETAIEENDKTKELIKNLNSLELFGGFVQVDGQIIAISVGEIIKDTLYVHIEKALKEYPGSYQMIMNEFAKHNTNESILYINREEDTGDLGLRTSKLSYHPYKILDKYNVTINE